MLHTTTKGPTGHVCSATMMSPDRTAYFVRQRGSIEEKSLPWLENGDVAKYLGPSPSHKHESPAT